MATRLTATGRLVAGTRTVVSASDQTLGTPIGILVALTKEITVAGQGRLTASRTSI